MEMLLVTVYLPVQGKSYEVSIPRTMNSYLAAQLVAKALAPLSEGTYEPSRSSVLAWRESGQVLNMHQSMEQAGVINSSQLLLV